MLWRRSYDVPPPPIDDDDEFSQVDDARYASLPDEIRPRTECLADVVDRMLPVLVRRDRARPADRADRARRGARQLAAGAGQASRRHVRRGRGRAQHPDRHPPALRARRGLRPHGGRGSYLDPAAAAAAIEAVKNQGR